MGSDKQQKFLKVENLHSHCLRGLDFGLQAGERIAIIGKTGEGKSVFIRTLLGLLKAEQGKIHLLGQCVEGSPVTVTGLGVAFQEPGLFDAWSLRRNLTLASEDGLHEGDIRSWLREVDLATIDPDSSVGTLSGGQKKRISMIRALLRGAELVVLDEPTSGLDPATSKLVGDLLDRHLRERGTALLMITHDLELAVRLCGRIVQIANGRIGPPTLPEGSDTDASHVEQLVTALETTQQTKVPSAPTRVPQWGFVPALSRFLLHGFPLSAVLMTLLVAILIPQISGLGPFDLSNRVPSIVTEAVFREMAPLVVGLLLASRIGAGLAAEIAGMSYTAQIDSMRLLGLSPRRLLLLPFAAAASLTFPICILGGAFCAIFAGSLMTGFSWSGLSIGATRFQNLAFQGMDPMLLTSCGAKGVLMGMAVVTIAYHFGSQPIGSAPKLGNAVTGASVLSAVSVVLIDVALSWILFTGVHS